MSSRLLNFIRKPFQLQMRKNEQKKFKQLSTGQQNDVWAQQMRFNEAGKVMNFKVMMNRKTKPADIRYCEQVTQDNTFILKYFNFSCYLCERLASNIFTSTSCGDCEKLFFTRMEARGICLDCCTQIQGLLQDKFEELSQCPLCASPIDSGEVYVV